MGERRLMQVEYVGLPCNKIWILVKSCRKERGPTEPNEYNIEEYLNKCHRCWRDLISKRRTFPSLVKMPAI